MFRTPCPQEKKIIFESASNPAKSTPVPMGKLVITFPLAASMTTIFGSWRHFGYFLVAGIPLAWATRLVHLGPGMPMWKIAATFVGVLWVVALSEEFFFRGLLQQWMVQWTGRPAWALAGASTGPST